LKANSAVISIIELLVEVEIKNIENIYYLQYNTINFYLSPSKKAGNERRSRLFNLI
jgi:hypothetical protein